MFISQTIAPKPALSEPEHWGQWSIIDLRSWGPQVDKHWQNWGQVSVFLTGMWPAKGPNVCRGDPFPQRCPSWSQDCVPTRQLAFCSGHNTVGWEVGRGDKTPKIPPPSASEPQKTALNSKVPSLLGASNYQIAFYVGRFPEHCPFQFFHIYSVCVCVFIYHPASLKGDSAPNVQHPHPQYPLGSPLFPAGECTVGGRGWEARRFGPWFCYSV